MPAFENLQLTNNPVYATLQLVCREFQELERNKYHIPDLSPIFSLKDSDLDRFLWKMEAIYRESPNAVFAIFHTEIYGMNLTDNAFAAILDLLNDPRHSALLTKFIVISYYRSGGTDFAVSRNLPWSRILHAHKIISLLTQTRESNIETKPLDKTPAVETSELVDFSNAEQVLEVLAVHKSPPDIVVEYLYSCLNKDFSTAVLNKNLTILIEKAISLRPHISKPPTDRENYDRFFSQILYVISQMYPYRSIDEEFTPELRDKFDKLVTGEEV